MAAFAKATAPRKPLIGLLVAAVAVFVSVQPSSTQNIPQGFAASKTEEFHNGADTGFVFHVFGSF